MVLDVLEHPLCIAPHPQVDLALHIQETYLKRTYARRYFLKLITPQKLTDLNFQRSRGLELYLRYHGTR
jgi:hypothetical protein